MKDELNSDTSDFSSIGDSKQSKDSNLHELTQFILEELSKNHPKALSIEELAAGFNINKRTVYYVTNVMMGLGFVEKSGVGKIVWADSNIDCYLSEDNSEEINPKLVNKNEDLINKKKVLEEEIRKEEEEMAKIGSQNKILDHSFIVKEDVLDIQNEDENKVNFLVRSPKGTLVDVFGDVSNYGIEMTSVDERIEVYFIDKDEEDEK